jgi:membrane protein
MGDTSAVDLVRLTVRHAREDALMAFAGNLTYNAFLAVFPFLLFLVSILKTIHATGMIHDLVRTLTHSLPAPAARLVRQQILPDVMSRLTSNPWLSLFLALGSLWAVSFVGRAIVQAMNHMYDTDERRSWWVRALLPLLFSLGAALLFIAALAMIVFGPALSVGVGNFLGSGSVGWWTWTMLRWPLLIALAFLAFALIYYWGPDVQQRVPFVSVGAGVSTAAWVIFSIAFSLVLNRFAQFLISPLYGWFTGLIILLMYLYWSSVIILAGAEINRVIEDQKLGARTDS